MRILVLRLMTLMTETLIKRGLEHNNDIYLMASPYRDEAERAL
jgi:hypothetical protein